MILKLVLGAKLSDSMVNPMAAGQDKKSTQRRSL
jgi:hypothetical protein